MKEYTELMTRIKAQVSPAKFLEERRQKMIDQTRNEYLKKVAINHD